MFLGTSPFDLCKFVIRINKSILTCFCLSINLALRKIPFFQHSMRSALDIILCRHVSKFFYADKAL
jgi:hypothetical protein